jgi:hypothetical protein
MKFHELNLVAVIEESEKKDSDKIETIFRISISILVMVSLLAIWKCFPPTWKCLKNKYNECQNSRNQSNYQAINNDA